MEFLKAIPSWLFDSAFFTLICLLVFSFLQEQHSS